MARAAAVCRPLRRLRPRFTPIDTFGTVHFPRAASSVRGFLVHLIDRLAREELHFHFTLDTRGGGGRGGEGVEEDGK